MNISEHLKSGPSMKKRSINYDGKAFATVMNSESGEVSGATIFHYHQDKEVFWAEYSGGEILRGFMIGLVGPQGQIDFNYQHLNMGRQIRLGKCRSTPEIMQDGRIRLHETWQWLDGEGQKGTSVIEELKHS